MKKLVISLTIVYLQCLFLLAANQNNLSGNGFNKSGWPLEVLSWDIDKAYPGIEYNYRLGVKGGEYPYNFTLVDGPAGMTINKNTGEILWTPASLLSDEVVIKISDIRGNTLVHQYVITSTKNGFYFVDSAKGNNTNDGSEEHPWLTMAYAAATADSSSYVYVKKGTYSETFTMVVNKCGRFFAYPGDNVTIIGAGTGTASISVIGWRRIFQGFNFDGNGLRWLFSISGYYKNLIWRNNTIHNVGDGGSGNPAGMFFWDGGSNPITGGNSYDKIVVQDNIFHDIKGSSIVAFDVKNMLFENNTVYNMTSSVANGIADKDMGYMNTIRGNLFYNCSRGIVLMAQGGQSNIEVCYNHLYGITSPSYSICVGLQNAYINDIFIHHNTVLGSIRLYGTDIEPETSYNINIYKNILGHGVANTYSASGVNKQYPSGFFTKVSADSNIIYGLPDSTIVSGYNGDVPNLSWAQWQDKGQDLNSKYMQLQFDSDNIPILPDSLKIYGCFGSDYNNKITDIKLSENENSYRKEYSLSQNYPNPFNPSTMINYSLPAGRQELPMNSNVSLKIFDILGREVATLVNEHKPAGNYTVEWNGTNSAGQSVGSGVYLYQLKTSSGFMETKKMLLIK